MTVRNDTLIIAPARAVRAGWEEAFRDMATALDDTVLLPDDMPLGWDEAEWEW